MSRTGVRVSKKACGLCGKDPAAGFAAIGDTFYCHGDDDPEPTCYMRSQWKMIGARSVDAHASDLRKLADS